MIDEQLGAAGEAFFVDQVDEPVDTDYNTSPLVSPAPSSSSKSKNKEKSLVHFELPSVRSYERAAKQVVNVTAYHVYL